ncbi:MAG: glycosyltransferase family 4 protein [Actinomycetota bacterium]|nr:glycosyltransferase family 4 protein [Actinomycetota bacterium]
MRTLVITNDFPPRQGGIQSYVHELTLRQPAGSVVVYASEHAGSAAFDAAQPFPVLRHPSGLLVPTPATRNRVSAVLREQAATSVWFGASAPLGLLAPALRDAGAERVVASSHGHEVGWAMLPGARQALGRIGAHCDVVTYISEYTRQRLAGAYGPHPQLRQLTPGVDIETFHPSVSGSAVRAQYGLSDRPVIVCVSRLVPRKGQDVLIDVLRQVRREVTDAALLLVGSGPYERQLRRRADRAGVSEHVVFAGGVAYPRLPEHFAAGDVFAMPCRTRRRGLDVEGLGIVYLEASAVGLPVVAGDSGGAPEAVREGETGYVVGGRDPALLTRRLVELLQDADLRRRMGAAGRSWVHQSWRWDVIAAILHELLAG